MAEGVDEIDNSFLPTIENARAINEDNPINIISISSREERQYNHFLKYIKYKVVTDNGDADIYFKVNDSVLKASAASGAEKAVKEVTLISIPIHHTYYQLHNKNLDTIFTIFEQAWKSRTPLDNITFTHSRITSIQSGGRRKTRSKKYKRKTYKLRKLRKQKK